MLNPTSDSPTGILYIDDEEKALKYFRMAYSQKFTIFTATSGEDGLELLDREADNISIVVSDQRMPTMQGTEVLTIAKERHPRKIRILTTAFSDLDSAIEAVNHGHIYQYVVKPWDITEFGMVLQRASDYFHVLMERNALLGLKMGMLQRMLCSDRLKWLLLACNHWKTENQQAFRGAVAAMTAALPDVFHVIQTEKDIFRTRDFDPSVIFISEYKNASQCLDSISHFQSEVRPVQTLLKEFQDLLVSKYSFADSEIAVHALDAQSGFSIILRPTKSQFSSHNFLEALFAVMVRREASTLSLLLLELLTALSMDRSTLQIVLEAPSISDAKTTLKFEYPPEDDQTPESVIRNLYAKFSNWDIQHR